ncbi:MAG: hypothetical protein ACPGQS_08105, partial [Bradymonadia bacterium]
MRSFWGGVTLSVVLATFGCEREKRQVDQTGPNVESSTTGDVADAVIVEANGWLASIAKDSELLVKLAEGSTLWASFLQNRHVEVLTSYDRLGKKKSEDALVCARSSVELAETALVIEELLAELQSRLVEIEKGRNGSKDESVQAVTAYISAALRKSSDLSLPSWSTSKPTFLSAVNSVDSADSPVTDSYKIRWSMLQKLDEAGQSFQVSHLKRKSKQLQGRDFSSTVVVQGNKATFDFVDPLSSGLTRHFYARKALDCLRQVTGEADLLRVKALRLTGQAEVATALLREHTVPAVLPLGLQVMTLDTSIAGYEQSLRNEAVRVGVGMNAGSKGVHLPFAKLRSSLEAGFDARIADKKSIPVDDVDPVVLVRNLHKKLAADGISDESTTSNLVSRYVDEVLRRIADVHFAKGEFARSAQIRRRIGGSEAFMVGPKVPPSALATCALEHWKIVEPRSALRYLKDLEETFPNAKRASGLLRDVL